MRYMLDTDICIYILKHKPNVLAAFTAKQKEGLAISSVTFGELECGLQKSNNYAGGKSKFLKLLANVEILPFDDAAAECYGKVRAELERKGTPIGPLDTQIAAHAKALGLIIVTNNVREFGRVEGLELENWAEDGANKDDLMS